MKEMFEQVIAMKNYDLKTLLANIDQYHIEGRLTDEERLDQGIHQNTIRLSIGTEHIDDIIADLENGFAAIS